MNKITQIKFRNKISLFCLTLLIFSCSKKGALFLTLNPPPPSIVHSSLPLKIVGPPLIQMKKNEYPTKLQISSQYFKIAIPAAVDMTGKSDELKNSLSDLFYTQLFETKRFSLMDRMEIKKLEEFKLNELQYNKKDTGQDSKEVTQKKLQYIDESAAKSDLIIDRLKTLTDGIMQIYITSNEKSSDNKSGKIGIDYRIVSTGGGSLNSDPVVLFAGSKNIDYKFDKSNSSISFNRTDINEICKMIKQKFPNPDEQIDIKIINKRGNTITINAGKNQNIISGMLGFVVKNEKSAEGNGITSYRAVFLVNEVFPESFNAILLVDQENPEEDNFIIPTIKVGEPIRMK